MESNFIFLSTITTTCGARRWAPQAKSVSRRPAGGQGETRNEGITSTCEIFISYCSYLENIMFRFFWGNWKYMVLGVSSCWGLVVGGCFPPENYDRQIGSFLQFAGAKNPNLFEAKTMNMFSRPFLSGKPTFLKCPTFLGNEHLHVHFTDPEKIARNEWSGPSTPIISHKGIRK